LRSHNLRLGGHITQEGKYSMAQQTQHAPGGHYSGHNPIPTVRQFIENLDTDKKSRDKKLDEEAALKRQQNQTASKPQKQPERQVEGTEKTVTDPTTGREVVIADVNKDMIDEVENPHLVVPNANLNKSTVRLSQYHALLLTDRP
jgi:hypothetical protein